MAVNLLDTNKAKQNKNKMNFDLSLASYIKINSKQIIDFYVKCNTIKL